MWSSMCKRAVSSEPDSSEADQQPWHVGRDDLRTSWTATASTGVFSWIVETERTMFALVCIGWLIQPSDHVKVDSRLRTETIRESSAL